MSRAVLLYGDQALLDEYNERVAEKLNTKSSVINGKSTTTVGFTRGIQVMMLDVETYHPMNSYLGEYCYIGALFDAKKQFYRLISLLLSDLGLIFNTRSPSPWQVISELQTRGIIRDSECVDIKVCLSIANEIRLKTYFANNGQKELFSPVSQNTNTVEQSADVPIFRDFNEDILVHLLSISNDICSRCREFCSKYIEQDNIDVSLFQNPSLGYSKAMRLGYLYFRLQNLHKALEWMQSESKDSLNSLHGQAFVYCESEEYDKSIECFEEALQLHYQNEEVSNLDVVKCINGLAVALVQTGKHKMATVRLKEAIRKHNEMYGEGSQTIALISLLLNLGFCYHQLGDHDLAVKTFKEVQELEKRLTNVPDQEMIHLNLNMAVSLSDLEQHEQSLKYLERALQLSHMAFGKHALSVRLAQIYDVAANVYGRCNLDNEAVSFFKRSLNLFHHVFGDKPHPGKIITLC
jgi:tetratricopeptide (TPR) repeat protein